MNQQATRIEPEDWSVLDLFLLGDVRGGMARECTPINANQTGPDSISENSRKFAGNNSPEGAR
jgi:hypothetical protein